MTWWNGFLDHVERKRKSPGVINSSKEVEKLFNSAFAAIVRGETDVGKNLHLKEKAVEEVDFKMIPHAIWIVLHEKYG